MSKPKPKRAKCPNCGNTDEKTLQTNGERWGHPDCTLLCVARVDPSRWAFAGQRGVDPPTIGADGKTTCAEQFDPWYD